MNITLEKNEGAVSGKLIVNIVKADYADKLANSLKKLKQKAQMPGFRKGMVPMSLIQKMYGTEVKADELQKILADGVNNYISDEKLRVLGEPMLSEDNEAADVAAKDDFIFFLGANADTAEAAEGIKIVGYDANNNEIGSKEYNLTVAVE